MGEFTNRSTHCERGSAPVGFPRSQCIEYTYCVAFLVLFKSVVTNVIKSVFLFWGFNSNSSILCSIDHRYFVMTTDFCIFNHTERLG